MSINKRQPDYISFIFL